MGPENIGPDEARAALAKVGDQRAAVARGDFERAGLLLIAGWIVVFSLLIVVTHGIFEGPWLMYLQLIVLAGFAIWRGLGQRVFSKANRKITQASAAASLVLLTIMEFGVARPLGWFATTPDWHLVAVSAVSVLPLLVGAWLVGRDG